MKNEIRTRYGPYGRVVHDVFVSEGHPWRAACEFWLYVLPGRDCLFTDAGNAEDWQGFLKDTEEHEKPTDWFAIVEAALIFYAETPTEDGYNPPGPNVHLSLDSGAKAREALEALDRLCQDFADRNAEMLRKLRDVPRREAR